MLVYDYFTNDNNEAIKNLQHEMYEYSVDTIFTTVRRLFGTSDDTAFDYTFDEIIKLKEIDGFDHRLLQGAHDAIAAIFRYKVQENEAANFPVSIDPDEIQRYFDYIYSDLIFLAKFPNDYLHYAYKFHHFLIDILKDNPSVPIVSNVSYSSFLIKNLY